MRVESVHLNEDEPTLASLGGATLCGALIVPLLRPLPVRRLAMDDFAMLPENELLAAPAKLMTLMDRDHFLGRSTRSHEQTMTFLETLGNSSILPLQAAHHRVPIAHRLDPFRKKGSDNLSMDGFFRFGIVASVPRRH
ncbi:MAG: hypothetical protein O2960_06735 [Verrucomicrobia bacterium]|nr:hypothetical protein [Verrucomicrobiota bacterium]